MDAQIKRPTVFSSTIKWTGIGLCIVYVLVAIDFGVFETFGPHFAFALGIDAGGLILIGVALTVFTLIPLFIQEREDHRNTIEQLTSLARLRERALVSIGTDQVWDDTLPVILRAEHVIETVIWGGPKAPDWWINRIRQHMIAKKNLGSPVRYDVLICTSMEIARGEEFAKRNAQRLDFFKREGLDLRVRVVETNRLMGIDVLIVDSKHVSVSISPDTPDARSLGLILENNSDAGAMFSSWFEKLARNAPEIS